MNWFKLYSLASVSRIICWIGPDGRTIPFPLSQEQQIVSQIGFNNEEAAYQSKYAKIIAINGIFNIFIQYGKDGLTSIQRIKIGELLKNSSFRSFSITDGISKANTQYVSNVRDFLKMIGLSENNKTPNSQPQQMPPTPQVNNSQKIITQNK